MRNYYKYLCMTRREGETQTGSMVAYETSAAFCRLKSKKSAIAKNFVKLNLIS